MSELKRMVEVKNESQPIGEFLEWLYTAGWQIVKIQSSRAGTPYITSRLPPIEQILADYYNIDLDEVENEKRAILEDLRRGECGEDV